LENQAVEQDGGQENDKAVNELLLRQLVHADKVLVNKVDLLKEADKDAKINSIKECV